MPQGRGRGGIRGDILTVKTGDRKEEDVRAEGARVTGRRARDHRVLNRRGVEDRRERNRREVEDRRERNRMEGGLLNRVSSLGGSRGKGGARRLSRSRPALNSASKPGTFQNTSSHRLMARTAFTILN